MARTKDQMMQRAVELSTTVEEALFLFLWIKELDAWDHATLYGDGSVSPVIPTPSTFVNTHE